MSIRIEGLEALYLLDGEGPGGRLPELLANYRVLVLAWLLGLARGNLDKCEEAKCGSLKNVLLVGSFTRVGTVSIDAVTEKRTTRDVAVLRTIDLHASVATGDQLRLLRQTECTAQLLL